MAESSGPDVFHAIADPTRRAIMRLLAEREQPIVELTKHFELSRTAVNKHLHILLAAGIVASRKAGRETRYRLTAQPLAELQQWLSFFEPYWEDRLADLKQFVEENAKE